jgi:hypothetical protein
VLATVCELKVVARSSHTEHYAVKSVMVLEASDDTKTKAATVHVLGTFDIAMAKIRDDEASWPTDVGPMPG